MRITMVAGSSRQDASSTALLRYIGRLLAARNISVTLIELRELPLPMFAPDSSPLHPNAQNLLDKVSEADGLILATPEYHGSLSGLLKNALDYMNAGHVSGKAVLSVSSAGGPLGVSSLTHMQSIVRNLHGINAPEWISIGYGTQGFDSGGNPLDEGLRERIRQAAAAFVEMVRLLGAKPAEVH